MEIVALKLITGEEIIAKVSQKDYDELLGTRDTRPERLYQVTDCVLVNVHVQNGQIARGFAPWTIAAAAKLPTVRIPGNMIVVAYDPDSQVSKQYAEATSTIDLSMVK